MNKQSSFYILESNKVCRDVYRINPSDMPFPKLSLTRVELANRQKKYNEVLTVTKYFIRKLLHYMKDTPTLIVISDEKGYIIDMYGDNKIQKIVNEINITTGVLFSEKDMGTNSLTLALKHDQPFQLIGDDHYHNCLQSIACMTAPFHFFDSSELSGTISIMTTVEHAGAFYLGLLASVVDSIERELKVRVQHRRLNILNQVMVNSTKNGIIMTDTSGLITEFNPSSESITGVIKENAIGQPVEVLKEISPYIRHVLTKNTIFENVEVTFKLNNVKRTCLFDGQPIHDDNSQLIGAYGKFRDITDRIELEKQLIDTEKLSVIGKLGAGLAHEIKNPLTSITGFIKLLKGNESKEIKERYINIVTKELERINQLVSQFVMMAKPSMQEKRECNILELMNEMICLMTNQGILHNVRIELSDVKENNWTVLINEAQIKQVIMNILQNAIEAMAQGGHIYVKLTKFNRSSKQYIQINIIDEGEGMTEDQVSKIFNPFYSSKEKGLGLGLSICKRIIESHHKGTIEVDSILGSGTTFRINLPTSY